MGLRISTNVQSLIAQRFLSVNGNAQNSALEHMSSGSKINKAADDAAGLAISDTMTGQIRSIRQATRNANDGISLIQTAEGGMAEISNILVRFRELSMQAASDTIGDTERGFIDKEVQQLKQEVVRIAATTEFNGKRVLSGNIDPVTLQVGTHNNDGEDRFTLDTNKINVTLSSLGIEDLNTVDKENARNNLDQIDSAIKSLVTNRAELGALQNRLQSTINNLGIYSENLANANSRIRDTDVAQESAELAKYNILNSAGVSVLSQANQNNMMALKLIG